MVPFLQKTTISEKEALLKKIGRLFSRKNVPAGNALAQQQGLGRGGTPLKAKKSASAAGNAWAFDFARIDL